MQRLWYVHALCQYHYGWMVSMSLDADPFNISDWPSSTNSRARNPDYQEEYTDGCLIFRWSRFYLINLWMDIYIYIYLYIYTTHQYGLRIEIMLPAQMYLRPCFHCQYAPYFGINNKVIKSPKAKVSMLIDLLKRLETIELKRKRSRGYMFCHINIYWFTCS